jgi:hypothetical protein
VVVFQPYKHYHGQAINIAIRSGADEFIKIDFLAAFTEIRRQIFKPTTIRFAFEKTGIIPYTPSYVLNKLIII